MSTVATSSPPKPASAVRNTLSIARRNLLHIKSNPELMVEVTIQPLMFLMLFVFVFGGAISGDWRTYLQFALPGILVQSVSFLPFATAIGLNIDFQRGVIDRFRSMPISRSAVIAGRIAADSVRITWSIIILTTFGMILGFRYPAGVGPLQALAAAAVVLAFGLTMCWPMAFVGVTAKSTESVNSLGFMVILPLTFASSAFANPATMPGWLGAFAKVNPVTAVIDTVRGFMLGGEVARPLLKAVVWMVGITLFFAPLAIAKYRKRG